MNTPSQADIDRLNCYADLIGIANRGAETVAAAWVHIGAQMERWAGTSSPEGASEIATDLATVAEFLGALAGAWRDISELRKEIELPPSIIGVRLN